ncbi:hypothetical protein TNIN_363371 [Trichonephila inaurata madagascariensis]|uniref:Uncharacterized protein n=1 Tax=Trichonephila inaurata madagascariensis TaxID=2747483 RepID=A0A8X7CAB8_9ARAC|nr:hypothetical protein TNIN_363371 [Trichonephila inaurata madagascariensis]
MRLWRSSGSSQGLPPLKQCQPSRIIELSKRSCIGVCRRDRPCGELPSLAPQTPVAIVTMKLNGINFSKLGAGKLKFVKKTLLRVPFA